MGVEINIEGLTKAFGKQVIWEDLSFTLPPGEIPVLLGPSGAGKSVFLKTLVGLLRPNRGHIWLQDRDLPRLSEGELYATRKLFGVLFQDGALFGSMNIYDNIAFPLREHTREGEAEARRIVLGKMEMVGLLGSERKLPGEISGGMRKRAGLARALVLDPQIILFDEPDSGIDPVRTSYLNQLIVDLNAETEATFLIVTHDITTARHHRVAVSAQPGDVRAAGDVVAQWRRRRTAVSGRAPSGPDRDGGGKGRRGARGRSRGGGGASGAAASDTAAAHPERWAGALHDASARPVAEGARRATSAGFLRRRPRSQRPGRLRAGTRGRSRHWWRDSRCRPRSAAASPRNSVRCGSTSLELLAPFVREFSDTLGAGRWFDVYLQNIVPLPPSIRAPQQTSTATGQ